MVVVPLPLAMREPPRAVDDRRVLPLLGGHRLDDRLDRPMHAVVDLGVAELLGDPRDHPDQPGRGPIFFTCCIWSRKSSRVKWPCCSGRWPPRPAAWSSVGLGLLDEREHVAHAEDPVGHAVGVELLEVVELLAGGGEHDRPADHLLHRQGGAAAGVAVDLGEDHAVEAEGLVERLGGGDRVLAGHGVDDEERVVRARRPRRSAAPRPSARRRWQPAGGVDDQDVAAEADGLREALLGHRHRIGRLAEDRHAGLLAEDAELLDRRRALEVGADQQRVAALRRLNQRASLAAVVVLPEPCRPASSTTVGGFEA